MESNMKKNMCVNAQSLRSCLTLCDPWTVSPQAPLSTGFSGQKYRSGLPCPPPGDFPDPGIKLEFPVSPALQADFLLLSYQESPEKEHIYIYMF